MTVKELQDLLATKPTHASVFVQMRSGSSAYTMNFPVLEVLSTGELVFVTCGKAYERAGGTA